MKMKRLLWLLPLLAAWAVQAKDDSTSAPAGNRWKNGPAQSADFFPLAVWLQDPRNAPRFQKAGFNLYVGLWKGPTEEQLAALRRAGMGVICEQNAVALSHKDDPILVGWMHGDEPDNAQSVVDPRTGKTGWGSCVPPETVVAEYERMKSADPTRPILLNLGQGVANDEWRGRGNGARLTDYETYVRGADVVSFDVYPVAGLDKADGANSLWLVPKGIDRLRQWTRDRKILWNCIECTHISSPQRPTPLQVKAEVWMSLVHGSSGLVYFVHEFKPKFREAALLEDPEMLAAVTEINRQIRELAPVLNSPTVHARLTSAPVRPADEPAGSAPVDYVVKRHGGAAYVLAVGMRNARAVGRFDVPGLPASATATVLGENRSLPVKDGTFQDDFEPYAVHLYRIDSR